MDLLPFRTKAVQDLAWIFLGPLLLTPRSEWADALVTEADLAALYVPHLERLAALDLEPNELLAHLEDIRPHGRLGRYFESLLQYWLRSVVGLERLAMNTQVRGDRRTLGELDLVYADPVTARPEHWEISVKFYISIARERSEERELRRYVGTLVEDRLDLKLEKLRGRQLALARSPEGLLALEKLGFAEPRSRLLLKGLFFYPSESDWRRSPVPEVVSPWHERGWWTDSGRLWLPASGPDSRWLVLNTFEWLAPFAAEIPRERLLTLAQLEDLLRRHFDREVNPEILRRLEKTVAEVEMLDESAGGIRVREVSRGHVVHPDWLALARASAGFAS